MTRADAPAVPKAGTQPGAGAPLLSVCILARDEEDNLARCITSARAVADEIVVYDTGSRDATVQVARDLGAVVVEATWPGDFASARNAALASCRGTWVLSLDADDELCCPDPAGARRQLQSVPAEHRALQVSIDNATGVGLGAGYANVADKLFRPDRCRWRGRLHEQLVDAATGELVASAHVAFLRITHHGYLADALAARSKAARNLALARAEVEDPSFGDRGLALVLLGRALWAAGAAEAAIDPLLTGAATTRNATARRQALAAAARILLQAGRADEAAAAVRRLRATSRSSVLPDVLDAGIALAEGRPADALALLEPVATVVRDDDGYEHGPAQVAPWRADALVALGRPGEAADLLLGLLRAAHVLDAELDLLVEALERAGHELSELADALAPELLDRVLAATVGLEPVRAARVLEAIWRREKDGPAALTVLAAAALLARRLPAAEATPWSVLLRGRGLAELCPLVTLALDPSAPAPRRRRAAAVAAALGDDRALAVVAHPGRDLSPTVTPAPATGATPRLSVVVVARHGAATLLGCLEALAAELERTAAEVELVVVDPGLRDATAAVVDGLAGDVAVVRFAADPGAARARNAAAAVARGEILLFLDAGATLLPGAVDALLAYLGDHPRRAAAGARLVGPDRAPVAASAHVRLAPADAWPAHGLARRSWASRRAPELVLDWAVAADPLPDGALLTAHALAVRRGAFHAAGCFDEHYAGLSRDLDLAMALQARGAGLALASGAVVVLGSDVLGSDVVGSDLRGRTGDSEPGSGQASRLLACAFGTQIARSELVGGPAGLWWCARDDAERFAARWAPSSTSDASPAAEPVGPDPLAQAGWSR